MGYDCISYWSLLIFLLYFLSFFLGAMGWLRARIVTLAKIFFCTNCLLYLFYVDNQNMLYVLERKLWFPL